MSIRHELLTRILCDVRPNTPADGVFLFGQTEANQYSVLRAAHKALREHLAKRVLILNTGPLSGYPGASHWTKLLGDIGVPINQIELVCADDVQTLNTLIEAEALIRHAVARNYHSLLVTAAPFHQERAFMTAVTVNLKQGANIRIFSYSGEVLLWHESVNHSQGTLTATRKDLIHEEQKRIEKYSHKGDLCSREIVLDYLNQRDLEIASTQ